MKWLTALLQTLVDHLAAVCAIPPDKIGHFLAGILLAAFGAVSALGLGHFGIVPTGDWRFAASLAGVVGGAVKEAADWEDDQARPGEHGVELFDFFATAAPGLLCLLSVLVW